MLSKIVDKIATSSIPSAVLVSVGLAAAIVAVLTSAVIVTLRITVLVVNLIQGSPWGLPVFILFWTVILLSAAIFAAIRITRKLEV